MKIQAEPMVAGVNSLRSHSHRHRFIHPLAFSPVTESQVELVDVTVHSPHTRMRGVQATHVDPRPWIEGFPVCQTLNQYQMIHLGIEETQSPTRIVRRGGC
jgi:hypothetical protein